VPVEARALGLPGATVAAAVLLALLMQRAGVAPFAPAVQMTLPEAAALESDADVVRLLRSGADPNRAAWVRRTRIRAVNAELTPLQAAMTSRHASVMNLLVDGGARVTSADVPALWCLAAAQRNADAQAWLRGQVDGPFPDDCAQVPIPEIGR